MVLVLSFLHGQKPYDTTCHNTQHSQVISAYNASTCRIVRRTTKPSISYYTRMSGRRSTDLDRKQSNTTLQTKHQRLDKTADNSSPKSRYRSCTTTRPSCNTYLIGHEATCFINIRKVVCNLALPDQKAKPSQTANKFQLLEIHRATFPAALMGRRIRKHESICYSHHLSSEIMVRNDAGSSTYRENSAKF